MVRLGHDPSSRAILMWSGDADGKNPAAWLADVVQGHRAEAHHRRHADRLRAGDTGGEQRRLRGHDAEVGRGVRVAQGARCHVHLLHHGGKGGPRRIDTALGTIGIVGKVGTVLDYGPLSKRTAAPRGSRVEASEGDIEDSARVVLDFDRERGLTVAGFKEDVLLREIGVALVKVGGDQPGLSRLTPWPRSRPKAGQARGAAPAARGGRGAGPRGQGNGSRTFPYRRVCGRGSTAIRSWSGGSGLE